MSPEFVAALLLSSLVGVTLGTFGSGGSILAMPVLVYVAHVPTTSAVGMSLVIVGTTAAVGCAIQAREYGIDRVAASAFAVTGAAGAYFGSRLTPLVAPDMLMLVFGTLMLVAGVRMTRPGMGGSGGQNRNLPRATAIGLMLGVLTGFLGVGGGFLIVPALVLLLNVETKRAIPTSLAVIAFNAAGGLAGHVQQSRVDWALTGPFLAAALTGIAAGVWIVRRTSTSGLRLSFGVGICLLGAAIVVTHAGRLAGWVD